MRPVPITITLRFRAVDRRNFYDIKLGIKTIETRAASERYKHIKKGDVVVIVCGSAKLRKRVTRVRHFTSIGSMLKAIPLKRIMPSVVSIAAARKIYYGYPGYKEKIRANGLVALELG